MTDEAAHRAASSTWTPAISGSHRPPISGRTALYLSTPERCVAISGMPDAQAMEMIEFLYLDSTADHNVYRHSWSAHDVVIWDNGCVMHRADHAGVVGDRVMHRGMVAPDEGKRSQIAAGG